MGDGCGQTSNSPASGLSATLSGGAKSTALHGSSGARVAPVQASMPRLGLAQSGPLERPRQMPPLRSFAGEERAALSNLGLISQRGSGWRRWSSNIRLERVIVILSHLQRGLLPGSSLRALIALDKRLPLEVGVRAMRFPLKPIDGQNHIVSRVVVTEQNFDVLEVLLENHFHRPRQSAQVQRFRLPGTPPGGSFVVPPVERIAQKYFHKLTDLMNRRLLPEPAVQQLGQHTLRVRNMPARSPADNPQ